MKWRSIFFSVLMFTVLFGVPGIQTFIDNDSILVFQEAEEKDMEEGEDLQLKDALEKLYYNKGSAGNQFFVMLTAQSRLGNFFHAFASQKLGVDTPPPEFS